MDALGRAYRDWIAAQTIEGCTIATEGDDRMAIRHACVTGEVGFYSFEGMPEVVELRVTEDATNETLFFLHFELKDLDHAKELFGEMVEAIQTACDGSTHRILLCCTVGMTTSMFAAKLNDAARTLSLDYEFEAKALEEAKERGGDYEAVMLAPQVGFRRREVAEAFPHAVVFEIPPLVFGTYDAGGALRTLLTLLGDESLSNPDPTDLHLAREMRNDKMVMLIEVINSPKLSTIAYRVYDRFKLVASDEIHKYSVSLRDIEDIMSTLHVSGVDIHKLDAVGIALPGSVDFGRVTFSGHGFTGHDIEQPLSSKFDVAVYVDNNANAAAVGCYVTQDQYDSVTLHTQQVGYLVGGEGTVANGHLLRGHKGMAGELGSLNQRLFLEGGLHLPEMLWGDEAAAREIGAFLDNGLGIPELRKKRSELAEQAVRSDIPWRADRMLPILATTLLATITVAAPDAIYISYDLIDDMDALHDELAKVVPEEFIPKLIHITDYREKIFEGEMALVLQRLNTSAT